MAGGYRRLEHGFAQVLWTALTFLLVRSPYGWSDSAIGLVGAAGALTASVAGRLPDCEYVHIVTGAETALLLAAWPAIAAGARSLVWLLVGVIVLDLAHNAVLNGNQIVIYALRACGPQPDQLCLHNLLFRRRRGGLCADFAGLGARWLDRCVCLGHHLLGRDRRALGPGAHHHQPGGREAPKRPTPFTVDQTLFRTSGVTRHRITTHSAGRPGRSGRREHAGVVSPLTSFPPRPSTLSLDSPR